MTETCIRIACSRKIGATKKEIILILSQFGFELYDWEWRRLHYARFRGVDVGLYYENKRWYSYQSDFYKSIVEFVSKNEKGITNMGMAMGCLPTWIDENHDIFLKTFNVSDF